MIPAYGPTVLICKKEKSGMVELEEIIEVYAGMARRIATVYERYLDKIDDLTQDVWIAVWQALPRLHDQAMLKSYVARITHNLCVTHVRRAIVRHTEPLADTLPDPATTLDETADNDVRLECLIEAVRSLPQNSRRLEACISKRCRSKRSPLHSESAKATPPSGYTAQKPH